MHQTNIIYLHTLLQLIPNNLTHLIGEHVQFRQGEENQNERTAKEDS